MSSSKFHDPSGGTEERNKKIPRADIEVVKNSSIQIDGFENS